MEIKDRVDDREKMKREEKKIEKLKMEGKEGIIEWEIEEEKKGMDILGLGMIINGIVGKIMIKKRGIEGKRKEWNYGSGECFKINRKRKIEESRWINR